jgi:hypothetical protein
VNKNGKNQKRYTETKLSEEETAKIYHQSKIDEKPVFRFTNAIGF